MRFSRERRSQALTRARVRLPALILPATRMFRAARRRKRRESRRSFPSKAKDRRDVTGYVSLTTKSAASGLGGAYQHTCHRRQRRSKLSLYVFTVAAVESSANGR